MENTLENKAKFFAQYYGQKVCFIEGFGLYKVNISTLNKTLLERYHLQLKDPLKISEEDAIQLAKIENDYDNPIERGRFLAIQISGGFEIGTGLHKVLDMVNYLTSKGYLLPFNGLSEDEILNRGWAVLEQPDNK